MFAYRPCLPQVVATSRAPQNYTEDCPPDQVHFSRPNRMSGPQLCLPKYSAPTLLPLTRRSTTLGTGASLWASTCGRWTRPTLRPWPLSSKRWRRPAACRAAERWAGLTAAALC